MAEGRPRELILASASRFRRQLLEAAGVSFRIVSPDVDEGALKRQLSTTDPAHLAEALARAKAMAVSTREPHALTIGADQVLALGDELFDKPGDLAMAREQLQRLRGQMHELHTAVVLAEDGRVVWKHAESARLRMRSFSDEFLHQYLQRAGSGLCQIVGAYEIEGPGIQLFESIEGDHSTIIGLPLLPLLKELRSRGALPT